MISTLYNNIPKYIDLKLLTISVELLRNHVNWYFDYKKNLIYECFSIPYFFKKLLKLSIPIEIPHFNNIFNFPNCSPYFDRF